MFAAILVLLFVPFLNLSPVRCFHFLPFQQFFFWLLVVDWFILGWIGACAPEPPFLTVGRVATAYYFLYFFFVLPFVGLFEQFFFSFEKSE
jgi:ubiquinol-cytochrome c reductase cytochrome b/c1 subunit